AKPEEIVSRPGDDGRLAATLRGVFFLLAVLFVVAADAEDAFPEAALLLWRFHGAAADLRIVRRRGGGRGRAGRAGGDGRGSGGQTRGVGRHGTPDVLAEHAGEALPHRNAGVYRTYRRRLCPFDEIFRVDHRSRLPAPLGR